MTFGTESARRQAIDGRTCHRNASTYIYLRRPPGW